MLDVDRCLGTVVWLLQTLPSEENLKRQMVPKKGLFPWFRLMHWLPVVGMMGMVLPIEWSIRYYEHFVTSTFPANVS